MTTPTETTPSISSEISTISKEVTTIALLTIIQGRDLSKPKEKKIMGSKTLAFHSNINPFVVIEAYGHHVGKTLPCFATLNPNFSTSLRKDNSQGLLVEIMKYNNSHKMTLWGDHKHKVTLTIWHQSEKKADGLMIDNNNNNKRMGTATLIVPPKPGDVTGWIDVEKETSSSGETKKSKGQLQVRLQTIVKGSTDTENSLERNSKSKEKGQKKTKKKKKKFDSIENNQPSTKDITDKKKKKKKGKKKSKDKKKKGTKKDKEEKEGKKERSTTKDIKKDAEEVVLPDLYERFSVMASAYPKVVVPDKKEQDSSDSNSDDESSSTTSDPTTGLLSGGIFDPIKRFSDLQELHHGSKGGGTIPEERIMSLNFSDLQEEEELPPLKIHEGRSEVYLKLFQTDNDILSTTKITKLQQQIGFIKEDLLEEEQKYYMAHNYHPCGTPKQKQQEPLSDEGEQLEEIVNFLSEEYEILYQQVQEILYVTTSSSLEGGGGSDERSNNNNCFSTSKTRVKLTIIKGQNLIAMNEDETSDPYVEIYVLNQLIKQTDTKYQTLNPIWNEQFEMTLTREVKEDFPPITLKIVDEDYDDQSNSKMGQIEITVPKNLNADIIEYESDKTKWYKIPYNSSEDNVVATGSIQIKLDLEPLVSKNFQLKQLESELDRLQNQLNRLTILNTNQASSSSSASTTTQEEKESQLNASKEYLQQNNRELAKQLHYLRQM